MFTFFESYRAWRHDLCRVLSFDFKWGQIMSINSLNFVETFLVSTCSRNWSPSSACNRVVSL